MKALQSDLAALESRRAIAQEKVATATAKTEAANATRLNLITNADFDEPALAEADRTLVDAQRNQRGFEESLAAIENKIAGVQSRIDALDDKEQRRVFSEQVNGTISAMKKAAADVDRTLLILAQTFVNHSLVADKAAHMAMNVKPELDLLCQMEMRRLTDYAGQIVSGAKDIPPSQKPQLVRSVA